MSNEHEQLGQPSDQAIALFLQENDADRLTDILVEALNDALRILADELSPETLH
jgi:DNA-binding protein YbaB